LVQNSIQIQTLWAVGNSQWLSSGKCCEWWKHYFGWQTRGCCRPWIGHPKPTATRWHYSGM